ncbi:RNA polymerase sigma-70 factor (ECF subfamily) [Allocatelliglobosispora scoriae]|uniref:RNA polymerase sigma-70 factor (ECF subfamily) n=1 Tax=Allocatelliglobosispora scoriae TaxID=643052 RepID=A0A841BP62_9ACTN|nr:sigma-70 family RNA polymerase sigma factor [Allocatelliglobosispora scoriae]MBB5868979.1 RNA polymerase sigma-70 factor (ECF subfamily) [Allocatelliglobosispora scoriae]
MTRSVLGWGRRPETPAADHASRGVDEAFADFYRAEAPGLATFLLYLGARSNDVPDLVQETMFAASRAWQDITNRRAWLRRVASREFGRLLSRVEPRAVGVSRTALMVDEAAFEHWEQTNEVLRQLRELPARQRQVMAWTYDGFSPSEIAVELGITREAVRSNLLKARKALTYLSEQGGV